MAMLFGSEENRTFGFNGSSLLPAQEWFNNISQSQNLSAKPELECPKYTREDGELLALVTFWVDGVVTCIMAIAGLIANIISALILGK